MSQHRHDIPVLLLHGFLGGKHDWHQIATRLQSGRRVAAFDLPGHGPVEEASEDTDCGMDAACHRIEAVLEALEAPRGHLVGYSLGARTALYFAVTRPSCVASLVLESGSAGIQGEFDREERRKDDEVRAMQLERGGLEAFVKDWEKLPLFESQKSLPGTVLAEQRARRLANDAECLARSLRHAGTGSQPWLGGHLQKVTAPVLIIAGALDKKFVAIARGLRGEMPNSRLAIVEGAGHNVHLEKPDEYLALVDGFLSQQDEAFAHDHHDHSTEN